MAIVVAVAGTAWLNRWRLGHTAVTIADPLVRAWAAEQVATASDSAYHLEASRIAVDEANRRVSIDSITVTTDSAVNARLGTPHPSITVRFRHCAVTGIDLTALAAHRGLHALHAGCDSVSLTVRTLVATVDSTDHPQQGADSSNFLRFQGKIDLANYLPLIAVDSVTFPQVHAAFDLLASDGRRTTLWVDSVAVALDSIRIDPRQEVAKRRPLFSRNVRVRLDRFAGGTKAGELVSLEHFEANLADGTAHLDAVGYERLAGARVDSTGAMSVHAQHVRLDGVRWRAFLLSGDVAVALLRVDSVDVRMIAARNPQRREAPALAGSIASALRSAGRAIRVDSLNVNAVRVQESGRSRADAAVTTLGELSLAHVDVLPGDAAWRRPFPIGRVLLVASGAFRHTSKMDIALRRLSLNAGTRTLLVDSLRAAPPGGDSAFARRNKYREARVSASLTLATLTGIDLPAFLARGAMRVQGVDISGFALDVMIDKHKPEDDVHDVRRTPQGWLRDANVELQLDTLTATGQVTYRERDDDATNAGILGFRSIQLHGYNFSTDPARMTAQTPFRLIGDTRLMGAGAMHVEWNVPLLSRDFAMTWKGTLGKMDPQAMNAFLPDAVGMRFIGGSFEGATWNAAVRNGVAVGVIAPRWLGLRVELPGVARKKSGLFGGIARGFAKLATNTFGIRGDNSTGSGHAPIDGTINHRWTRNETLPDFIWSQIRDPLLLILKK